MNFVLVHLGTEWFDYIADCIEQISKYNDCLIYMVTSNIHADKIRFQKIIPIYTDEVQKSEKHEKFERDTRLDREFRGGFWKFATQRFFYIEDVMNMFNLTNVFHLENDNLIFFDVKDYITVFEENYDIAAIFDNDIRCIPGFMYFKNNEGIGAFTNFINDNNGYNDMELLPKFNAMHHRIKTLPIMPENYSPLGSTAGHRTADPAKYWNNIDKFNSVFDGAAIGQYLGGVDPRNVPGDTRGFINESCLYNVSAFQYEFKKGIPYMKYGDKEYRINNMHVHSKNLKQFMQ